MRPGFPISTGEFLHLLQRCMPPDGWPRAVGRYPSFRLPYCLAHFQITTPGVANSGGPDSACLLFLLASVVRNHNGARGLPQKVVSLHVNHALQKASFDMVHAAEQAALRAQVHHRTLNIPWGRSSYPDKPQENQPSEQIARDARYRLLFRTMIHEDLPAIAYGHHADDQVETAIMRLAMGSSDLGAAGMRPVRRWGMGESSGTQPYGPHGMSRWIVRPLLTVPKVSQSLSSILDILTYAAGQNTSHMRDIWITVCP